MDHLTKDDYLAVLRGEVRSESLHHKAARHLVQVCGRCRDGGYPDPGAGGEGRNAGDPYRGGPRVVIPELPENLQAAAPEDRNAVNHVLSVTREAARRAREDLAALLRLPRSKWRRKVEKARSRYQSRAFAEALLDKGRACVRADPHLAADLFALVRPALDRPWRRPLDLATWGRVLWTRAEAHRANALRVAGDLGAAGKIFAALGLELSLEPLGDARAMAEIHSLEASFAIGQRKLRYAHLLLQFAVDQYRTVGDPVGQARAHLQQANLHQTQGQPAKVEAAVNQAVHLFDPEELPDLHLAAVQARLNALLDLDRGEDAAFLLQQHGQAYLRDGDPYLEAMHLAMTGRVALALANFEDAISGLESARDRLFDLGRNYDAILASLYLADAYLAAGQLQEVQELAKSLVPLFEAKGVEREMLASLRLLSRARQTQAVLSTIVADLRQIVTDQPVRFEQGR